MKRQKREGVAAEDNYITKKCIIIGCGALVIVLVVFFLTNIFSSRETYTSIPEEEEWVSAVICNAEGLKEGFFDGKNAESFQQEIRIAFNGEKPNKLSYSLVAEYSSTESAEEVSSNFHAKYNIYMGREAENLTPTFNHSERTVRINLFADNKNLDALAGKIFFLKNNEYTNFFEMSKKEIVKIYKSTGFACKEVD